MRTSAGVTYLHGDHLGSVSASSDGSGGALTRHYFTPWGQVASGGISATALNFTGQRLDATGLLYYHARYYHPVLGRFASGDTLVPSASALTMGPGTASNGPGNPQELNRYSSVNNNPVKNTDPSGHFAAALAIPLLAITAPAWVVPVAIGVAVIATAAVAAYVAVQVVHNADTRPGVEQPTPDAGASADSKLKLGTTDSWGNLDTLTDHTERHGPDFGITDKDDYAQAASDFLQRSQKEDLPTKINGKGVIKVWDPNTEEFGSYNPDGTTKTYYKPDPMKHGRPTNEDYWNNQKGKPPWTPR